MVFYPNFYGAFFGFSEGEHDQIFFCACHKTAILNFLNNVVENDEDDEDDVDMHNSLLRMSHEFPQDVVDYLKHYY